MTILVPYLDNDGLWYVRSCRENGIIERIAFQSETKAWAYYSAQKYFTQFKTPGKDAVDELREMRREEVTNESE